MTLVEALETVNRPFAENAKPLRVYLGCGFTPLHLETFLRAHLRKACPTDRVEVSVGIFGDLAGNLERVQTDEHDAAAVELEWADLDLRLGLRSLGGWQPDKLPDILSSATRSLVRLASVLQEISSRIPVCVSLPTLPLPPISYTGTKRSSSFELSLRRSVAEFAENISRTPQVSVVSEELLQARSPFASRFDLRSEIAQGFPYTKAHASAIAEALAALIRPIDPKKGLITDLDDVLWAGLLGEVGVEGIQWDLAEGAQLHGLYQQLLASLAAAGVLIGGASKNEAALVDQALERTDLLLSRASIFPIEANWGQKSESVQKILRVWNILPSSVVFVDDSPMEVAEVQAAFPDMECLVFPKENHGAFWQFIRDLRDRFAKTAVSEEDNIRLESLRSSKAIHDSIGENLCSPDDFLREAEGEITFDLAKPTGDVRALELLNKTNQFNLNGRRIDEAEWSRLLADPARFVLTVSYEDKFGRLGRIAVIVGRVDNPHLIITHWVMSCRAFSRRIEFHCLGYLFTRFDASEIALEVTRTGRNGPLLELLRQLTAEPGVGQLVITKSEFLNAAPMLPHHVQEVCAVV